MSKNMKPEKREELINSFLAEISEETRPFYSDIILYLAELGYNPQKEKSNISFKHDLHNKQIAKMGVKNREQLPFFALRFSACKGYSQRFADIVSAYMLKYPSRTARCTDNNGCNFCAGEPDTHVYTHTFPDGETKLYCGAYAVEILDIKPEDIAEIKRLIKEEHDYLLKHQTGIMI
jgi:hypothetical protein